MCVRGGFALQNDILKLVSCHYEGDEEGFRQAALELASSIKEEQPQIYHELMDLLESENASLTTFFKKYERKEKTLFLPECITDDLVQVVHTVNHHIGVNKYLFKGKKGYGKNEAVIHIAKTLNRDLYRLDLNDFVNQMVEPVKLTHELMKEVNSLSQSEQAILLFAHFDVLLKRPDALVLIESSLKQINDDVVLIATVEDGSLLNKKIMKAFDGVVDFDRYTNKDMINIAEMMRNHYLKTKEYSKKEKRIFRKMIDDRQESLTPDDLRIIMKSISSDHKKDKKDYLKKIYGGIYHEKPKDFVKLRDQGFTLREIEMLTGKSKSTVERRLKSMESH